MKTSPETILNELSNFNGSDTFTKWSPLFRKDVLTDGAMYLAESAECFWLMDAIASHQHNPKVKAEDFQVWTLKRKGDGWTLTATDGDKGDGEVVLVTQDIEYSDFPLPEITLWACRNEAGGRTIMLPSEY